MLGCVSLFVFLCVSSLMAEGVRCSGSAVCVEMGS